MVHRIVLKAISPIAHGDTSNIANGSNVRLFMRQGVIVNGKFARVPAISENALRSVIFRRPLHDHLLQYLQIEHNTLPQSVVNLLYSGGNMASGSRAPGGEITLGHTVKRMYPSIDLLGGAVDQFILPRSRLRITAWIVAKEYLPAIQHVAAEYADEAAKISAYDIISEETRTRGTGDESEGNQMLYTYETLAAGTKIIVELALDAHTPPATEACIPLALSNWDGFIGGQGRQGRGKLIVESNCAVSDGPYLAHLEANAPAMLDGLVRGTLGTDRVLCA